MENSVNWRWKISIVLTFFCFIVYSCHDNLRTMPLSDFTREKFGLTLEEDSILDDSRNFPGNENRGQAFIIAKVINSETIKDLQSFKWLKSKPGQLVPGKYNFKDLHKEYPVIFDRENQYIEILYDEMSFRFLDLRQMLKDIKLTEVYYKIESNKTQFGNTENKVLIYDKTTSVLFLIFDN